MSDTFSDLNNHVRLGGTFAGGTVSLTTLTVTGTTTLGTVLVASGLPTADPHVAGQVWANSGVLTVSAG